MVSMTVTTRARAYSRKINTAAAKEEVNGYCLPCSATWCPEGESLP